ncbi:MULTISPECIES: hypothetical protein [unclassified Nostoc]|uniref:hypothetical protein n=1 Tax=unclassified Nostoc TaxID=2593658 RepID=UPI0013D04A90|nr:MULTISPECIES: hypothetical protein [unclassified Nostoc]MBE8998868.1 hypothetical protein [Nostoc sp. LEGE 12447]NEU83142.1 hypothetical protein [Nostoc sp. UIC 10630]
MSTQIMQSVQENELFSEMSAEESATVSGGNAVNGATALAGFLAARTAIQVGITPAQAVIVTAIAAV